MFDLEVILPVCGKFLQRLEDFKRYGLVNLRERSVRVNMIVSGEIVDGLHQGWPAGVTPRTVQNDSAEYVANIYGFYLSIDPESPGFRWLIRLDDDSCTDVDGLVSNLDKFYGHEGRFCLGDVHALHNALNGQEGHVYNHYQHLLGECLPFSRSLMVEIECGILSSAAASHILSHPPSVDLIRKRSELTGGYGDVVVALAAFMASVPPASCPFVTHMPLLNEFSLLGGHRNHIHQMRRKPEGENFWRGTPPEAYDLLVRLVEGGSSPAEERLTGRRLLLEDDKSVRILELLENHFARLKPEGRPLQWYGLGDLALVLNGCEILYKFDLSSGGPVAVDGRSVREL